MIINCFYCHKGGELEPHLVKFLNYQRRTRYFHKDCYDNFIKEGNKLK